MDLELTSILVILVVDASILGLALLYFFCIMKWMREPAFLKKPDFGKVISDSVLSQEQTQTLLDRPPDEEKLQNYGYSTDHLTSLQSD